MAKDPQLDSLGASLRQELFHQRDDTNDLLFAELMEK